MDKLYLAHSYFKRHKYEECVDQCTQLLDKNPLDQAAWILKMRALTEQVYVDDLENLDEGIADATLDDESIAQIPRPGTSLRATANATRSGPTQGMRPPSHDGRILTGVVRPYTRAPKTGSIEQALKTPRTAHSSRPLTTAAGMRSRIGTSSIMTEAGGPFIQLSKLNFAKYAAQPSVGKPLFEYIYYCENDIQRALEFAVQGTQKSNFKDWWWKLQLGRCYLRIGLLRDAEQQLRSSLRDTPSIIALLMLARVYTRMDQPLTAIQVCQSGMEYFPKETALRVEIARLYEGLGDLCKSVNFYRGVLKEDATNIESIACIGMHHFYSDQPEVALQFYRRLLQTGINTAELFNNLGLCCYYSQQYDMTITCFERALNLVDNKEAEADIWYNVSHVAIGVGDSNLACQSLRLALMADPAHAPAYNNLGVMEARLGRTNVAQSLFQASAGLAHVLFEPHYNYAKLALEAGQLHSAYVMVKKALVAYPEHVPSKSLLEALKYHFQH
ncbi:Hypothetical predicted protein [Cloeon dipterum]|uniref:Tetratricopeptide repeat protein 8 n=1 Tax=Cloeon dipterum TaxID=197152 RepID=A0A8S1CF30_9INSE|nr:Hypothetical predicted protein [Cloeon dipterum]